MRAGAVLVDPVDDVAVRRKQAQAVTVLDGLQWPDPGVEGLFGSSASSRRRHWCQSEISTNRQALGAVGGCEGKGRECIPPPGLWISTVAVDSGSWALRILAGPFTTSACVVSGLDLPAGHGAEHEAHFQPEQPASQASPRLPCAHGHQGWSSGPRPSSRQGPQAPRGLTVPRAVPPATVPRDASRAPSRLTDKPEFDAVHRKASGRPMRCSSVITRPNALGPCAAGPGRRRQGRRQRRQAQPNQAARP
jgi:hypothetical protein